MKNVIFADLPALPAKKVLALVSNIVYHFFAALLYSGNREEVSALENLTMFLVSVGAGIISYYVCKWLDRHGKGK